MFQFDDLEIEVEYQGKETIGKYNLDFDGINLNTLINSLFRHTKKDNIWVTKSEER